MQVESIEKLSLFDHLKHIITMQRKSYHDELTEESKKTFNPYMIQRFLSMNVDWLPLVNYINPIISTLNKGQYYRLIITLIPKQPNSFYKYIKKQSKNNIPEWLLDIFINYFKLSRKEVTDYILLLKSRNINRIIDLAESYGINDKQRKELQKWSKNENK